MGIDHQTPRDLEIHGTRTVFLEKEGVLEVLALIRARSQERIARRTAHDVRSIRDITSFLEEYARRVILFNEIRQQAQRAEIREQFEASLRAIRARVDARRDSISCLRSREAADPETRVSSRRTVSPIK